MYVGRSHNLGGDVMRHAWTVDTRPDDTHILARNSDGSWCATHPGALRPIVVEADSWPKALLVLAEMLSHQEAEEYAYCEAMTHFQFKAIQTGDICNENSYQGTVRCTE